MTAADLAHQARTHAAAATALAHFEERYPCDGMCRDYPEEDCSRHGRTPADLWQIVAEVQSQRDALTAQINAIQDRPATAARNRLDDRARHAGVDSAGLRHLDRQAAHHPDREGRRMTAPTTRKEDR